MTAVTIDASRAADPGLAVPSRRGPQGPSRVPDSLIGPDRSPHDSPYDQEASEQRGVRLAPCQFLFLLTFIP
jgi:hypothetical protein